MLPTVGVFKKYFPAPGAAQDRVLAWQPIETRMFAPIEDLGGGSL